MSQIIDQYQKIEFHKDRFPIKYNVKDELTYDSSFMHVHNITRLRMVKITNDILCNMLEDFSSAMLSMGTSYAIGNCI